MFSISYLLGQVVIDDEGVHAVVPEVLSHGTAGVRGQVLERGSIRGGGTHHNRVLHCIYKTGSHCNVITQSHHRSQPLPVFLIIARHSVPES